MTPVEPRITARWVEDHREGENVSGYAILVDGKEMTRVAWVRRFGADPDVTFQEKLDHEIEKARHSLQRHKELLDSYNELFAEAGTIQ